MGKNTYEFDIREKKLVNNCNLFPTETIRDDFEWLCAVNNKYDGSVDPEKVGKWVIFLPKNSVNAAWSKIKEAVTSGKLWRSKVSTADPGKPKDVHTIIVCSKDYTDVSDVIHVLDYVENSGIKPRNSNIKYSKGEKYSGTADTDNIVEVVNSTSESKDVSWIYSSNLIRSVGSFIHPRYEFDVHKNELVSDSKLCPTETLNSDFPFLEAVNNKYSDESLDPKKTGKWMLFLPKNRVNAAWEKIKTAIKNAELWRAKVFASNPERPDEDYAIMIHTKDYTDLDDVIRVLDYLESSGIKPLKAVMKYKTDQQTLMGIYPGGRERPSIYSSDKIRSMGMIVGDTYEFDVCKKELVSDCSLYPTQVSGDPSWLYAKNNKYPDEIVDPRKVGKWLLFLQADKVDTAWDQTKRSVQTGQLWHAKVSTYCLKNYPIGDSYTFMFYTKDFTDLPDIIQVLDHLESCGIKPHDVNIKYKTDEETHVGYGQDCIYYKGSQRTSYFSNTIRSLGSTPFPGNSIQDTFEFDIRKKELVTDCKLYPTQVRGSSLWLYAKNNKYPDELIDTKKLGSWISFAKEDIVNAVWDKIKMAVTSGELWYAKVSTCRKENHPVGDSYTVNIYTKDYSNLEDVVRVLDFLESSRIKPPDVNIGYRLDGQTVTGYRGGGQKPLYFSNTVRNEFKMDLPWR